MATPDVLGPEAVAANTSDQAWLSLLGRLNVQSVKRHFDAYADVDWDSPQFALDPEDPRWELPADDPLGQTSWYRQLPAATRARLGCDLVASKMKIGLIFESILKRGLLEFASTLPNRAPEFRYAYHEIIEEAQHSLMFQEFVNRSGLDAAGLPRSSRPAAGGSSGSAAASRSCSSCSSSAAKTPSITCSAANCVRNGRFTRCSSGSCGFTSPRKPVTSPSPATTSSAPFRPCPAGAASGWRSPHRSSSVRWPR